ncbi:GNAT family N-acetyltransferase [Streptomyces sp. MB09-01]|uniref:GNAT family N-acetyltransferase n=1 Tax=Streptomyces sp. MB09-01 TaxID=3028666 RepID=UPI0029B665B9|nr:GNAT family N-acetyltransferase [Streptomyces sp. MB09-01]MDX3539075.1 GNAT family N-acetyltransferase [Streptomyces sp. MB09-01]
MIPDERRRTELLPGFFRVFVDLSAAHHGVLTTDDGDAVLLFLPPGAEPDEAALDAAFTRVLGEHAHALRTIARLQAERHPHTPHYYVSFGAVRPGRQQSGLISRLLAQITTRADAEGAGTYTEASSPGGEAATRRAGFDRLGSDITLPDGGPALRPMWRNPR